MPKRTVYRFYEGFVQMMVDRREALGFTRQMVDERAGFACGFTARLENWRGPQGRVAGSVTMPLWLAALGLGCRVVPIDEAAERARSRAVAPTAGAGSRVAWPPGRSIHGRPPQAGQG